MHSFLLLIILILILCMFLGFIQILRGPSKEDRMLAAQLFSTVGVAILLVFSVVDENANLLNLALVLALLTSLTLIAFTRIMGVAR